MKRTLSIILTLVLLLGALPLTVFAADVDTADTGSILSGTTGTAQFTVEDRSRYPRTDGGYELSVIGTNSTYEQTGSYTHTGEVNGNAPWMAYKDYINLIKIKDVKYLRKDFYSCGMYFSGRASSLDDKGLTVTLDDKLLEINSFCFYNAHITSINFSDAINLEKIDEYSFYGNDFTELETNADTIGHNAFENCNNLKNVTFTNLNTTVGVDAFSGCNNIDYVFWAGTPESFNAALASGNDCLKNADVIEYGNQKSITQPIYLTVVEPVVGKVPDYSITLADNEYCELDTATYDRTGLDIMNLTTNQPANWWPFEGDCTYRYFAYMQGKSGQNYQYVFTKDTPVYINGKKAKIEAYRLLPSVSADAYIDFTLVDNRCTVTFDKNGGSGTMNPVTVNGGSSYKLPECTFTPPSGEYEFAYWTVDGINRKPGDTVTVTKDLTVTAVWQQTKYVTVTYESNGGTGTMGTYQAHRGYSFTLPNCSFTPPSGKMFDCWLVDGQRIKAYGSFVATKNVTAVAQWVNKPVITTISKMDVYLDKLPADGNLPSLSASAPIGSGYHVATDYNRNYYQNGILWSRKTAGGNWTNVNPETERFVEGTEYRVNIMMFPDDGYEFNTSGMTATLNGEAATVPNEAGSSIYTTSAHVTQKFTCGPTDLIPITEMSFTVTAPVAGQNPDYNVIFPTTSPFEIDSSSGVSWRVIGSADTYVEGETYSIMFYVIPDDGFYFDPDKDVMITINGEAKKYDVWSNNKFRVQVMRQYVCEAASVTGSTVSGSFTSFLDNNGAVTVQLLQSDTVKYSTTATGNTASYSITGVANGAYTLRVSKKNHVDRDYDITVSGNTTQDVKICPVGDINGDGNVNTVDYGMANSHARNKRTLTGYAFDCGNVIADAGTPAISTADAGRINSHARNKRSLWT